MKLAIILFNLGGPDSPEAIQPFLRNLFSDPAIIALPGWLRRPLAAWIARRRTPLARGIYSHLGGRSPILEETRRQAEALEHALAADGVEARAFIAMRCWHPFSDEAAEAVKRFSPDQIVALPLYPQHSTTTSASSLRDWDRAARKAGLDVPTAQVCCYPDEAGFVCAVVDKIRAAMGERKTGITYRLLLSAHGLPKKIIAGGDPYQWQVERTARAIVDKLGMEGLDWTVCYQSRVGPLKWLEPSTDGEIRRAGAGGMGIIIAPIAFVSEHSETLVELDIEYGRLAHAVGVPDYRRLATVSTDAGFIGGLARLVQRAAAATGGTVTAGDGRICPAALCGCGFRAEEEN